MSGQLPFLMDEDLSPQNRDVLLQIASLIRLAGSFRLGFVKCNQPFQSRQMAARLKEMLVGEANIIIVELKEPVSSLRRAVLQALESDKSHHERKRAIMVLGFEYSVPSEGPAPALDELNQSRENFPKSFSGPVLIWLPDYALTRLAREAPDFWGWRSGVFELSPELRIIAAVEKMAIEDSFSDNLSLSEKIEKVSALEGLIRDYHELPREERMDRSLATVLHNLGNIYYLLGVHNEACRLYAESLEISRELGDKSSVASTLHQMGMITRDTGYLDEARRLYAESLEISRELGDYSNMAGTLHQIGNMAYDTGDLVEASRLYAESLKISRELGNKRGVAQMNHQMGMVANATGDQVEARRLYEESLKIEMELGDKRNMASTLHQMGMMAQNTGDLVEARRLYEESLKIEQDLGNKQGVAHSLHQIGMMAQNTGDLVEARRLYLASLKINQELGNKRGIASTLVQSSFLEEKEGHLGRALALIKQAEVLFLELRSPNADEAQKVRERLEREVRGS
jgi:tetratricopeptide (TPR) repeat protein